MYGATSEVPGESVSDFLFSSAHCCLPPSIWRRLLMQVFFWAELRAFTKFGMAMAASRPMMATTIMISTSVKPALRVVVVFICFVFYGAPWTTQRAGLYDYTFSSTHCLLLPRSLCSQEQCQEDYPTC